MTGRRAVDVRHRPAWATAAAAAVLVAAVAASAPSAASASSAASPATITAFQWNPHWQCFEEAPACQAAVVGELPRRLGGVDGGAVADFANLVEVTPAAIQAAGLEGWTTITSQCVKDVSSLLYNARRWRQVDSPGSGATGCMVKGDRPFVVQAFEWIGEDAAAPAAEGLKLIVVGAHFPHYSIGDALPGAVRSVAAATGLTAALLIADTNIGKPNSQCPTPYCMESADILRAIGVVVKDYGPGAAQSTELLQTCCLNNPPGFIFQFDRVISNFGSAMATKLYDEPVPSYAVGAFHKAIQGSLTVSLLGGANRRNWTFIHV